jgi:rhodanese-related sulfurtransferase
MKSDPGSSSNPRRSSELKRVLVESAIVALIGIALAGVANALSPRGLSLVRNYFPGVRTEPAAAPTRPAAVTNQKTKTALLEISGSNTNAQVSAADSLAARLKANGLQLADSNLALALFRDPRRAQELIVFIDARDDEHYREGHVPGAYQLDHYRAEQHLPGVLPVCQTADQIVLYCQGGDCEDSEFAALTLSTAGIPKSRLWIYGGGMMEWITNGWPVELGSRNRGDGLSSPP